MLRGADITFANLEMPLSQRGIPAEKQNVLRGDPAVALDVVAAGVDVVSLANNHMLDFGVDALSDTLDTLHGLGIRTVGAGADLIEARAGTVIERGRVRVGFLAFASTLPQGFAAGASRPGIAPVHVTSAFVVEGPLAMEQPGTPPPIITLAVPSDLSMLSDAVASLKQSAEFVVVSAHWGVAGQDAIMDYQQEIAHELVRSGADLILGHHPHRLQAVEFFEGVPIVYSLGNFIFEPLKPEWNTASLSYRSRNTAASVYAAMRREGVAVEISIEEGALRQIRLHPIELDANGHPSLRGEASSHYASILAGLSAGFGTRFRAEDEYIVVTANEPE